MAINSIVLNNGVVLITEPIATAKTVAIGFYFSVGSRNETQKNRGITHFVEHLLFKGTKTRSSFDISKTFDRIGGYSNAFTEKEDMCIHCTVPSVLRKSDSLVALDVLCDMTENCVFDEDEIEKEREVVKNEILSIEDDFEESAYEALARGLWKKHNLGKSISGSVDEVDSISRAQIVDFYRENIVHGELVVCVAGNFDEAAFRNRLENLSSHTSIKIPLKHFSDKPTWKGGKASKKSDFSQQQLFVLHEIPFPISEREYYALVVLNAIWGDTMSSRLFQSLREKFALCYTVYSFITLYEDIGCIGSYVSCETAKSAYEALVKEIANLKENPPSEDELIAAKEHLCGEEIMNDSDMEMHIKRLNRNFVLHFPERNTDETIEIIRSISKNEVQELINRVFDEEKSFSFLYGKKKHGSFIAIS